MPTCKSKVPLLLLLCVAGCAGEKASGPAAAPVAAPPAEGLDPDGPPLGSTREARERDVDAGEVRLHVRIVGPDAAPTTLLVANGGPASYEYITGLDALAGPDRRVVYYDMRGVAPSTKPASGDYQLDALVADFEAVRAAIGAPQVDALGHSWGTLVAAAYAASHPDRIRSLVLANPMALTSDVQKRAFQKLSDHEDSLVPFGLATDHPPEPVDDDCTLRDKARVRRYFANPRTPYAGEHGSRCYVEARKKSYEAIDGVDFTATFARLRGPVLVLTGDADPFGQEPFEQVVQGLVAASVTRVTITQSGHDPFLEAHADVTTTLRKWLAGLGSWRLVHEHASEYQKCQGNLLPRRAAWPYGHASGSSQRRPAGLSSRRKSASTILEQATLQSKVADERGSFLLRRRASRRVERLTFPCRQAPWPRSSSAPRPAGSRRSVFASPSRLRTP